MDLMRQSKHYPDTTITFKELFHSSPLAIYTCDVNGIITFYNKAATDLWGNVPEVGKDLWCGSWKIYHVGGSPMAFDECPMALTVKHRKSYEGNEIVIERPDGTFRNLLVFPRPVFNDKGVLTGAHNTLVDITEQKKGEDKQAILSAIVESSDDAIISKNLNGIITSWNKGAQKIFGYTEEEIIGKPVNILIPPDLQSEEDVIIKSIRSGKKIDHFQTVRIAKDGKKINISLTVSPVKDSHGNVTGASKIARDISDQLQKEREIKEGARRLEILNSIGKDIAGNLDFDKILQRITDATTTITGAAFGAFFYNTADESGESFMLCTSSGAPKEAVEKLSLPGTGLFNETFSGKSVVRIDDITRDTRYGKNAPHKDIPVEDLPVVSYLALPVIGADGNVLGVLFLGHPDPGVFTSAHEDLVTNIANQVSVALENSRLFTEVKNLSAKKDEFIALASHELKTPITTIKGYLQILQKNENDKIARLFLDKSLRQVNKLTSLISDLFDASKIEAGKLNLNYEVFDLSKLVLDITETFHYSAGTHKIILDDVERPFLVEADKQRIEQVIINLFTNAIKYSPNADKVFVSLSTAGNSVQLTVKDEGIGLTSDQQKQIFTRFFRVDGNSNISGLGLGLYLSKEIVDRHNGILSVKSEPAKGSKFSFTIPLKKDAEINQD